MQRSNIGPLRPCGRPHFLQLLLQLLDRFPSLGHLPISPKAVLVRIWEASRLTGVQNLQPTARERVTTRLVVLPTAWLSSSMVFCSDGVR